MISRNETVRVDIVVDGLAPGSLVIAQIVYTPGNGDNEANWSNGPLKVTPQGVLAYSDDYPRLTRHTLEPGHFKFWLRPVGSAPDAAAIVTADGLSAGDEWDYAGPG